MEIRITRLIAAPVDLTFQVFSDVENIAERIEGITQLEVLSEVKHGVGTRWRETRVMFGQAATEVMEISAFQPNQSYEVVAASHGTRYHSRYTFTEKDGGTHVEMVFTGTPVSFMAKLMAPVGLLMKGSTQKALEADMDDLKAFCEAHAASQA